MAAALNLLLLYVFWISLLFFSGSLQLCIEKERKALLSVRSGFPDVDSWLSPWKGDECCSWEGVGCNNITGHVIELDISTPVDDDGDDDDMIPANKSEVNPLLFELKHLHHLDLSHNNFDGTPIPESIGSLTQLEHLDLSYCGFSGEIPNQLGNLSDLLFLALNGNNISGEIPATFIHLASLQFLFLEKNNISGEIPGTLGNLCNLRCLYAFHNRITGELTEFFEQLTRCKATKPLSIVLSNNEISGPLPNCFERLQRLIYLDVGSNQLSGSIPPSLGKLSAIKSIDLSSNYLVGDIIEAHFANLTSLYSMDLSYNNLSDNVRQDWLPPFRANDIRMRSCNLGPRFPPWLKNQTSLSVIDISNNGIANAFPDWFWSLCLSNMELNVSHNHMKGMLPSPLECFRDVSIFDLSYNNFEGSIPRMHTLVGYLDLSHNSFSGLIPKSIAGGLMDIAYVFLSNNKLNGRVPSSICTERELQILDLANNDLSGTLPDCWRNATSLLVMDVSNNKLSGRIPRTFKFLDMLQSLHLNNNSFSGTIPSTLQHCTKLVVLDLSWNRLSGVIPRWIGRRLSSLQVLSLRSNKFTGTIPLELSLVPSLHVLNLAQNFLSGSLPASFGNFNAMMTSQNDKELGIFEIGVLYYIENYIIFAKDLSLVFTTTLSLVNSIDLSYNNLSGMIPEELTNLHGLRYLNLSSNYFSGQISEKIDLMGQLESLDLSKNNLSGKIPSSISALTFLTVLNLSYNNLVGKIPVGPQLQTFTNLSYMENPELCGEPLETKCPGDNQTNNDGITKEEHMSEDDEYGRIWYFIGFAPGFVFGFWGFMGTLMIKKSIRIKYIFFIDSIISWFMHT